ncbi:phosphoadenosine phosphosulfate reductase [Thalassococcus sp. CAU 1522]|uniref:Phosphoadenosine phosphosulfate reductase n=1 Tax=Thalassococcus arenae TaxID=2851652 RepID=A0ABS6N9N5_9RHOB|nr:phosphoadenosine phosphosulfate reductase [Thalassococcus arenae]MBV2360725.1 phosphoadenosine phosphosulfate reductase [Thalassococcus arenae]
MTNGTDSFPPDLSGLSRADWLKGLRRIGQDEGFAEPLGKSHAGLFVERGDTLLVSFENMAEIDRQSPTRTPFGFEMVARNDWSSLSVLSHGNTWFRDPMVYGFFDQMLDDGFFDDFERVIFYGAGSCGYAAAAYSVAAPGARVLILQPQATLDPRVTEWDDRFAEMRRTSFTDRYGFAPDMLDAAHRAYVLYDPRERLDAMHSALFNRRNVERFRLPFMGQALQDELLMLDLLPGILEAAAEDRLDTARLARLMRARRNHPPYLRRLLAQTDADNRVGLSRMLCRNVVSRMNAPRFRRRLAQLEALDDRS